MTSHELCNELAVEIAKHLPAIIDHNKLRIIAEGLIAQIDEGTINNPADTAVGNYQPMRRAILGFAAQRLKATGLFPELDAAPFDPLRLVISDAITKIAGCYLNENS